MTILFGSAMSIQKGSLARKFLVDWQRPWYPLLWPSRALWSEEEKTNLGRQELKPKSDDTPFNQVTE
jgi:hypothetical protein